MNQSVIEQFRVFAEAEWMTRVGMNYPGVLIFVLAWIFAFGACLGSFMNVCIWRIPRGESLSLQPSHCGTCNTQIKWYDNIPVVSYLVLRGRCRSCHTHYSPRYLIVEIICGLLFAALPAVLGWIKQPLLPAVNYFPAILYCVTIAWIDAEYRIIPDKLTIPFTIWGLLTAFGIPALYGTQSNWLGLLYAALSGLLPAAFLALFAVAGKLFAHREVLGWGDVKFILCAGVLTGISGAIFALLAGSLSGTVYGAAAAIYNKKSLRKTSIPFGPFLAGSLIIWMFAGNYIMEIFRSLAVLNSRIF